MGFFFVVHLFVFIRLFLKEEKEDWFSQSVSVQLTKMTPAASAKLSYWCLTGHTWLTGGSRALKTAFPATTWQEFTYPWHSPSSSKGVKGAVGLPGAKVRQP